MAGRFDSKAVANWLIPRFDRDGRSCTQLQLNKLVYIFHGWHLAIAPHGEGLVAEPVMAWKYGPVIPSLRNEFKDFGPNPITRLATEWVGIGDWYTPRLEHLEPEDWEMALLEWGYGRYGHMSGLDLIQLTHQPDSPWSQVTRGGTDIGINRVIPVEVIREHYRGLLNRLQVASA